MLLYFLMNKLGRSFGNMSSLSVFNCYHKCFIGNLKRVLAETTKTYSQFSQTSLDFGEIPLTNNKQKSIKKFLILLMLKRLHENVNVIAVSPCN